MKNERLRIRTPPFWFALFLIPWCLLSSTAQNWSVTPDEERGVSRRLSHLSQTFDAGDFYLTPAGRHPLLRFGSTVLDRADIAKARRHPRVHPATAVFVEPDTGLVRLATEEILIRLKAEVDPQTYFGKAWTKVKRLAGTRDQFILTLALATPEELLAESNRRASDPRVVWAQPNFFSQIIKQTTDPLFIHQWSLDNQGLNGAIAKADVHASNTWTGLAGISGVVIALLDDGVQLDHPDLHANLFTNPGELPNGLDNDGNGYVEDLHGWDFYGKANNPSPGFPEDNHGTAGAGVAAAAANNEIGVAGLASNCQILPLKIMGGGAWAPDTAIAEAVYYAAGRTRDGLGVWRGADVISIALSFPRSAVVDDALAWAAAHGRGGKGCPIFAAAGDDASRWMPTRIRLPVGVLNGPGTYRFGFEYSKDVSSLSGEDLVKIDNVALLADDGVTQLDSPLGPAGRQDFESDFPPPGWRLLSSLGSAFWSATTNGALAGTRGLISAQSGRIGNGHWTELRTPPISLTGAEILSFSCYISSEADYDGLKIWVFDENDNYLNVFEGPFEAPLISGNAPLSSAIAYPARHPNVIAVGASSDHDVRSDYSQSGPELDFLAPSSGGWNDILTTDRTGANGYSAGDYVYDFGGTSAASPLAAAIAALVLSVNPVLTASEVRTVLRNSCEQIGNVPYDESGWNPSYGYGRLNAQQAVDDAKQTARANLKLSFASLPATVKFGNQLTYDLSISNQGPTAAFGIMLTNMLPESVRFVSSSRQPLVSSSSTLVFDCGALASGGAATVTIVVDLLTAATVTNVAQVASATPELDAADNQARGATAVDPFHIEITSPPNNATLLAPGNITIAASAVDFGGVITNVEFFAGTSRLGQSAHPPYAFTWLNPAQGNYSLSARVTDSHGVTRRSEAVSVVFVPSLTVTNSTVLEANTNKVGAAFIVRLSAPSSRTITVDYSTADGSAVAGRDYVPAKGTLVFPPGATLRTNFVGVFGNTLSQSNRAFIVNLSNPVNAAIKSGRAIGSILDNDAGPALFINDVTVKEGSASTNNALFTVRLSAPSGKTVTVNYSTSDGTALSGLDYVPTTGTLLFAPGVTNQTLAVAVIDDTLSENTETFLVHLSQPVNAVIGDGQGVATILDDDPFPVVSIADTTVTEANSGVTNSALFPVFLSTRSGKTINVSYTTINATALAAKDFIPISGTVTFLPGTTNQFIRMSVLGDSLSEGNETFAVRLTNAVNATLARAVAVCTILDNDPLPVLTITDSAVLEGNIGATNALFTIRLSAPSGRPITVDYATSDGSALAGHDYISTNGTVMFAPGVIAENVIVRVIGDTLSESNETFFVNLSNPINASLARTQGMGTILDNDVAPAISINDVTVKEGDTGSTNAIFTVRLSARSGKTVAVNYSTSNGTALANQDYVPAAGTLFFLPGVTNQTLMVAVLGETARETNETFLVLLSKPVNASIADGQGICRIMDDDFRITGAKITGTNILISFTTLPDCACRIEYTERFPPISNAWFALRGATNIIGSGKILTATNLGGAGRSNRFYRVRMLP